MIKHIMRSTLMVTLGSVVVSFFLLTGLLYNYFSQVQMDQLHHDVDIIATGIEVEQMNYLQKLPFDKIRVTWIDEDGKVMFDSHKEAKDMPNHANREEIKEARHSGYGHSTRYSHTILQQSLYVAKQLSDNSLIRVSLVKESIWLLLLRLIQPFLLIGITVSSLSVLLARFIARRIVWPLNQLDLDNPLKNEIYDELSPLLKRLDYHQKELSHKEGLLQQRQEEFDTLISKIKEAFVLVDKQKKLVSFNSAAAKLFQLEDQQIGEVISFVIADDNLNVLISKGLSGIKGELVLTISESVYKILVRPVSSQEQVTGAVLLAFDVTEQMSAEQLRRQFTANVSHELKTPLHVIAGYSEIMSNNMVSPEDVSQFAGKIYQESQRLVTLIEDLISLSELDELREMPKESLDLYRLAENVLGSLASKAQSKAINLTLKGESLVVQGNPTMLHSCLYNLCDNAITYNQTGGLVSVILYQDKNEAVIEVVDDGIGISPADQQLIFDRFYRVDKSRSRTSGGTGLGLSIVKHVLEGHDATIKVDSQLGKGTRMQIRFPL